jgi:hypothetical protein
MQVPDTLTYATLDLSALLWECWLAIPSRCPSVSVAGCSEGAPFVSRSAEPEAVPVIDASSLDYLQHSPSAGSCLPSFRPIIWQPPCVKAVGQGPRRWTYCFSQPWSGRAIANIVIRSQAEELVKAKIRDVVDVEVGVPEVVPCQ